ncbi:MAG TPA: histidine phosphatase family protein [Gemmatimonadaceae bacterium]|nr:histidine phosphatase family protein [Gemmatimonadaceae bacterium]
MKLVIVRHADAGDAEEFAKSGKPDELRPLSDKGRKQMRSAAEGLRALVPKVDLVATSPYVRALETADIVAGEYKLEPETTGTLEPETAPEDLLTWLRKQKADVAMVVGHEPDLGALATWLMSGLTTSHVELKKGGACLLEFEDGVKKGGGVLQWLLSVKQLAREAAT